MADWIASSPETWVWPADVRARLDAQRIAVPVPQASRPATPASASRPLQQQPARPEPPTEDDQAFGYLYGDLGF